MKLLRYYLTKVGGLGQGMAFVYSDEPDNCGQHYFGIVPVWDKGDRVLKNFLVLKNIETIELF